MFLSTVDRMSECHLRMAEKRWETLKSQIGEETTASRASTCQRMKVAPKALIGVWDSHAPRLATELCVLVGNKNALLPGSAVTQSRLKKCNRLLFQTVRNKTQNLENPLEPNVVVIPCKLQRKKMNFCVFIHNINISIYTCYASLSKVSLLYLHPIINT